MNETQQMQTLVTELESLEYQKIDIVDLAKILKGNSYKVQRISPYERGFRTQENGPDYVKCNQEDKITIEIREGVSNVQLAGMDELLISERGDEQIIFKIQNDLGEHFMVLEKAQLS